MLRRLLSRLSRRAAERLVAEGNRAEAAGRFAEACERYQQALKILPGHVPAYLSLGIALEGSGDARSAREAYLATLKGYETNRYQLTPGQRAEITRRWGDVIRRYGYGEGMG